jgi:hypothetical protein
MNTKEDQEKLWKSVSGCFEWYETKCSPASWSIFRYREGWYLLLRFASLLIGLIFANGSLSLINFIIGIFALLFFIDIIIANTSIAFVTKNPISDLRSLLFSFFTFTHLILIFSICYKFIESQFEMRMCTSQALYFSAVTITTLGYGDIHPQLWATTAQFVTIIEVLTGLYFIAGIFARIFNIKHESNNDNV